MYLRTSSQEMSALEQTTRHGDRPGTPGWVSLNCVAPRHGVNRKVRMQALRLPPYRVNDYLLDVRSNRFVRVKRKEDSW